MGLQRVGHDWVTFTREEESFSLTSVSIGCLHFLPHSPFLHFQSQPWKVEFFSHCITLVLLAFLPLSRMSMIKLGLSRWSSSLRVRWLATVIAYEALIPFFQVRYPVNHYSACHKPLVCARCGASWCWGRGEVGLKMMLMVRSWSQSCRRTPTIQCGWWLGSW